jgi:lysophospholipase L1-like esterase
MKKIKLLFQGDSITDAGRNREDIHDLGFGYPKYAAEILKKNNPDVEFEFVDLGISGNEVSHVLARMEKDIIDIQPDIVSILLGINDVWHYAEKKNWIDNAEFENDYRTILTAIKERTNAKIMILEPFLGPVEEKAGFREDLPIKTEIIRKLAREFADEYVPLDGLFASEFINHNHLDYMRDGVHPTNLSNVGISTGAEFLAGIYAEYMQRIIDRI